MGSCLQHIFANDGQPAPVAAEQQAEAIDSSSDLCAGESERHALVASLHCELWQEPQLLIVLIPGNSGALYARPEYYHQCRGPLQHNELCKGTCLCPFFR